MTSQATIDGPRVEPASGRAPRSMVILAHGYGSNGDDLIGLAPYWRDALPDTVFIAPDAPEPCPGAPGGFQWWPVWDPAQRETGVRGAAAILDRFIDTELARYGLGDDRLALVGFSQGTMLSLYVAPRRERRLAGVVGYSGMLMGADAAEMRTRPPVLLIHGDADPMIPVAALDQARTTLAALGFDVSAHVSPGLGHSIDMPGLNLAGAFLSRVLA